MKFISVFVICAVLISYSTASYENFLKKCSLKDWECLKVMYQNILQGIGSSGISELGIPPIDPMEVKDLSVSLLGLIDITLVNGKILGISGCVVNDYMFNPEKSAHQEMLSCNITVQGQYKVKSNPIINSILGEDGIHGEGNIIAKLEKVQMTINYLMPAQKRDDGEIYVKIDARNFKNIIKFLDNVEFQFDQLYIGEQETSQTLVPFMNQNWKLINRFGAPVGDKMAEIYVDIISKFFNKVPMKHFISDDLSSIAEP